MTTANYKTVIRHKPEPNVDDDLAYLPWVWAVYDLNWSTGMPIAAGETPTESGARDKAQTIIDDEHSDA
jgi:hypothetical protein